VTGTPIQNRLSDLSSLIQFIRVNPFDDPSVFDAHILRPWKNRSDISAVNKLKTLVKCISIRRTKGVLRLPPRDDQIRRIDFSEIERDTYEALRLRIKAAVLPETASKKAESYPHVLRWIDDLRAACSHGVQEAEMEGTKSFPKMTVNVVVGQPTLHQRDEDTDLEQICSLLEPDLPSAALPLVDANVGFYGGDEFGELDEMNDQTLSPSEEPLLSQGLLTPLPSQHPSQTSTHGSASPSLSDASGREDICTPLFTKIKVLLADLIANDGKRYEVLRNLIFILIANLNSVVFSFWRSSLDLVSGALRAANITFSRIDGNMQHAERALAIETFQTRPHVKVLLATISVGGVG
jgi:SWI/SNF-related matrix-associated actin-dependent regulator of chromatin subfamily A3